MNIMRRDGKEGGEVVRPVVSLRDMMHHMFDESFLDPFEGFGRVGELSERASRGVAFPKVDISETPAEVKVVANIPGVDAENVDIEVEDDMISISGKIEKESKEEDKDRKFYRYEREYGEFQRAFALPARVRADAVVAKAKNGILEITLPKAETEKRAKVKVQAE